MIFLTGVQRIETAHVFFFHIDGKFILELSHRTDGERTSWVPVPKKTYWPPPAAAGTPRQESSTSLSGIV